MGVSSGRVSDGPSVVGEPGAREPGVQYRADIDGLRAVAILVVVLYHAGVTGFSGGFIGVDVFFVISGWLITQQLLYRSLAEGRVRLLEFWARRIRRLVPASFCMIAGTTLLSVIFLSPLDWRLIAVRGAAAALYVSNLLFAARAGNYFSGPLTDSPYLHTWSLGVEEQFYLLWPVVFGVVLLVARGWPGGGIRRTLMLSMAAVFVVSMIINLRLTDAGSPWGFFGLQARAWEFAIAGFLASLVYRHRVLPARFAPPIALGGLVLIAVSVSRFDDLTPYPGTAALLPVVGTLLVLLAGQSQDGAGGVLGLLRRRPVVVLGLLSYSWYLWHWPLMTIAVQAIYRDTVAIRLSAAGVALLIAAFSYRFVENPIRFSKSLRSSLPRTYALGAVLTLGALSINGALYAYQRVMVRQEPYRTYDAARQSYSKLRCEWTHSVEGTPYCVAGAIDSPDTVMLVGDSHAAQWMTALGEVAKGSDVRIVLRAAGNCSATPLISETGDESATERRRGCAVFQQDTRALIRDIEPAAVILADANGTKQRVFTRGPKQWQQSLEAQVLELSSLGTSVGVIVDSPISNDPLLCLARGRSESYCTVDYEDAMQLVKRFAPVADHLQTRGEIQVLDVNDQICSNRRCSLRADGEWVYAAFEHLTQPFTRVQEPALRAFLSRLTSES